MRYGNALRFTKNDVRRGNMRDILIVCSAMRACVLGAAAARQCALWMARRSPLRRLEDYLRASLGVYVFRVCLREKLA